MRNSRGTRTVSALTIAGSDSGGGAGLQADLLTLAAHGVYGATVIVAGTAQNTRGITAVEAFSPRFVARQLDAVFTDLAPAAVKIGMLCDAAHVRAVAAALRRHGARNVVVDPVLRATSGRALLSPDGVRALGREILPLCDLVTPNLGEASVLAGMAIHTDTDRRRAARRIAALGARAVLVTGGHGHGPRIQDLLWDGRRFRTFEHTRIDTRALHGTGCVLSSAVAANLALGHPLEESVVRAIRYLRRALRRGVFPGKGAGAPGHLPAVTPRSRTGSRRPRRRSRRSRS
jgi:hydroxymethylpyrimidine/phosphomethylpyrimidine kinase